MGGGGGGWKGAPQCALRSKFFIIVIMIIIIYIHISFVYFLNCFWFMYAERKDVSDITHFLELPLN